MALYVSRSFGFIGIFVTISFCKVWNKRHSILAQMWVEHPQRDRQKIETSFWYQKKSHCEIRSCDENSIIVIMVICNLSIISEGHQKRLEFFYGFQTYILWFKSYHFIYRSQTFWSFNRFCQQEKKCKFSNSSSTSWVFVSDIYICFYYPQDSFFNSLIF